MVGNERKYLSQRKYTTCDTFVCLTNHPEIHSHQWAPNE